MKKLLFTVMCCWILFFICNASGHDFLGEFSIKNNSNDNYIISRTNKKEEDIRSVHIFNSNNAIEDFVPFTSGSYPDGILIEPGETKFIQIDYNINIRFLGGKDNGWIYLKLYNTRTEECGKIKLNGRTWAAVPKGVWWYFVISSTFSFDKKPTEFTVPDCKSGANYCGKQSLNIEINDVENEFLETNI